MTRTAILVSGPNATGKTTTTMQALEPWQHDPRLFDRASIVRHLDGGATSEAGPRGDGVACAVGIARPDDDRQAGMREPLSEAASLLPGAAQDRDRGGGFLR